MTATKGVGPVVKVRSMKTGVGVIVLLAMVLGLGPTLSSSEAGGRRPSPKDVVLYELNEQARFTVKNGHLHREASSGIEGKAGRGTPLCPEELIAHAERVFKARQRTVKDARRCTVVAFGNSDLDVDNGHLVPVLPDECAPGDPTVRLEITFD